MTAFREITGTQIRLLHRNSFNVRSLPYQEFRKYIRRRFIREAAKLVKQLAPQPFIEILGSHKKIIYPDCAGF